jgi:hypothetical protein
MPAKAGSVGGGYKFLTTRMRAQQCAHAIVQILAIGFNPILPGRDMDIARRRRFKAA